MKRQTVAIVVLFVVISGCTTKSGDGVADASPPDGSAQSAECAALSVLRQRCGSCHSDPPRFGAPMPLVEAEHLQRPSLTVSTEQVVMRASDRINRDDASRMPPPSSGDLSPTELAALNTWFDRGAPDAANCEVPIEPPPACVGPDCLPCTPTHSFAAHGPDTDEPFALPATSGDTYMCFTFRSPFSSSTQLTAWAPDVDDERVIHHMILYRTATPQTAGASECNMPADAVGLAGWAPGGVNAELPADVGLEAKIEADEWLILQMHYSNPAGLDDVRDQSGLSLCSTETPRRHKAGVLTLGSLLVNIPARSSDVQVTGNCSGASTLYLSSPLTVLASGPHMHALGTRFRTDIYRAGALRPQPLIEIDPWDFNDQRLYWHDPPVEIRLGDTLTTTCTYDNPTADHVVFGERTEDEMCFNFALVYPIDAVPATWLRSCLL